MIIEHLKNEFETRTRKNANYSLRAFAKSLRVDSSTLSAILSGKRVLTTKTAKKLLEELDIDPETKKKLLLSTFDSYEEKKRTSFEVLDEQALEVISGWEHYAILSVLEMKNFKGTVRSIASYLNISTSIVLSALYRMQSLGLVRQKSGNWFSEKKQLTTKVIPSSALKKANREYIEKALYSLENHGLEERTISGITMSVSKKKLTEAFKMIQDFRRSLCEFLEQGDRDAVYRINIQLFPLKK